MPRAELSSIIRSSHNNFFFFQAEDGIRDGRVTGVQTCAFRSRRDARVDQAGDLVTLEEQDRRRWNRQQIAEALPLVGESLRRESGPFALQAAIAAEHCKATRAEDTDWPRIVRLYDTLERVQPSPIVSLNRAVAVAMMDSPRPALALIDAL